MEQNITPEEKSVTSTETTHSSPLASKIKNAISVKSAIIIFCILLLIGIGFYFRSVFVAASVNGDAISRITVIKKLEETAGAQVLDGLISTSLIETAAKKNNIEVTEDEITAELQKLEAQFKAQATTLDDALSASNLTRDGLREQIIVQKKLEKMLADKVIVTDEEVTKYIADNKITVPAGGEESVKTGLIEQLKIQKLNTEVESFLTELRADANIKYYVNY